MCDHRFLDDPDGLVCTREDPHDVGHTYATASGSEVNDKHPEGGHG